MNRKLVSFTSALIILFLATFLHKATVEVALGSSTTTIFVNPPTSTAMVGQTFFIEIRISGVSDLYGWEFKLKWNPNVLDLVNVTEGPFLKQGGNTFFTKKMNNTEGYILVDCTLLGNVPGVSGSGTLANVKFYAKNQGESILDLCDTILVNSREQPIYHSPPIDGYGYFTPPHDVAVISITVSPTTVPQGQSVNINVTVQNQGVFSESFDVTVYHDSTAIEIQPVSLDSGVSTILAFTWDTAGVNKGDYVVSAEASVVPGETDIVDNTKVADGVVTVLSLGHDVAIKGVTPSKTIVGQGYPLSISVTAKNYGSFTENFNLTAYYNDTNSIATQTIALLSGNSTTITFAWNTTGVPYGNYNISAYAWPVPGETDIADNIYGGGTIMITVQGDIDGDGEVRIKDIVLCALAFGSKPGDPNWNPNADLDNSGDIRIRDIVLVALHFGEHV